MADEILIKVRADVDGLQADVQNAKKTLEQLELLDKEYKPKINFSNLQELQKSIIKISSTTGDIWDAAAFKKKISESVNDSKALNEIRNQFVQMANSADKTDASFDELIATIKGLDKQIEFLNNNPVEVKVDEKPMVSLRTQMRQAQQEVAELSLKFGATSKEATEAAKRASLLKDAIGDAKDLTDAFSPDAKFNALSGSIQGVVGGFTAVQGAIGAFGVKSEEVEKALLKVNSAMALSQGLQSVGQSVDSFKNLGTVIKDSTAFQFLYNNATKAATAVQAAFGVATTATSTGFKVLRGAIIATGIGALVVALGAVIANFDSISAWIRKSPLGGFANSVGDLVQKFTDLVGITSKGERQIASLDKFTKLKNQGIERQIKLLTAQGGKEAEIAKLQKESTQNEINLLTKKVDKKGVLYGEDAKNYKDLQNNLAVIDAAETKRKNDEAIKANEKAQKDKEEANQKAIKAEKELAEQKAKDLEFEANARSKFNAVMNEKELEDLANKNKTEKDLLQAGFDDLDEIIQAEDKLRKEAADKEKARQQELIARQKQALNDLVGFAQNGILLQIGLNPADVNRLKSQIEGIDDLFKSLDKQLEKGLINQSQALFGKISAGAEIAQSAYQSISGAIFSADSQRRQEELAALQGQQEEELRLAGDNEQKKDLIKQKYALKEREIKRRQAEADKRKAILDATVNTAVAVIKTFATLGFPAGIVGAAIVAALGAAQIALIAAQPIPKFAKGGAVPSSDINGMISGRPHAAGGVLIEAEGNEFITRRSQAMKGDNLGLLEAINMSDSERDAYINRHYVMPALQAKESQAAQNYRSSIIEAENNLIARVSSHTLKSIHREQKNTTDAIKGLAKKDYTW